MKARTATALARQSAWLGTMRLPGGFGGPVSHWWQNRFRYCGPGLDWRYEGMLAGYALLFEKTRQEHWREALRTAADDLRLGQMDSGFYRASSFEVNPGSLGTPHEAAASLGLLQALPHLEGSSRYLEVAKRNLDALIGALWDPVSRGFNDLPGIPGRVPNKLATLSWALLVLAKRSGEEAYLDYAKAALDDVVAFQVDTGTWRGAVHQYAPDTRTGDDRFFPYYNARCVPPLVAGAEVFADDRYLEAARGVAAFLRAAMTPDGAWPQILYASGAKATWPRWLAGAGDILLAFESVGEPVPEVSLERLLDNQNPNGSFPTGEGFASQRSQRPPRGLPDAHDLIGVVGWNDKTFRLLAELLPEGTPLPSEGVPPWQTPVVVGGRRAVLTETTDELRIEAGSETLYLWKKHEPWAQVVVSSLDVR